MMRQIKVGNINIGSGKMVLIAGPCVIESAKLCLDTAKRIKDITAKYNVPYIFKSSYDKANRMSVDSFRGPGIDKGLEVLAQVKSKLKIPVLSDVHCVKDMQKASRVLDIIQIPAFLCRQTDMVVAAASTGKIVNIKKGQFLAPWDIAAIIKKAESTGNKKIILTERGVCFGYNNLVMDFRSLKVMRDLGYPVIYDATHSIQLPAGKGTCSGGEREFVPGLCRAAVAFGCDGLFLEVHPNPDKALCDASSMISLQNLEFILKQTRKIEKAL
ncbi:MAG: 3-deoxy-8-phosphooctulonate synthase [Candidatus Omnitrophica bacterium]|nr:3-deoxy-8-phosphooctulonate synthase [Candidatus Omnitrophota bacterium]